MDKLSVKELGESLLANNEVIFGGVVSSANFGLCDNVSDTDIRFLIMPSLDEVIRKRVPRRVFWDGEVDMQVHDVRRFPYFCVMGDMNMISMLFSKDFWYNPKYQDFAEFMMTNRERIAEIAAAAMRSWGNSMFDKKLGQLDYYKANEEMYRRFGYNTKNAAQAIGHIKVIGKFMYLLSKKDSQTPFADAMNDTEIQKEVLAIRHGKYSRTEFEELAQHEISVYCGSEEISKTSRYSGWLNNRIFEEVKKGIADGSIR